MKKSIIALMLVLCMAVLFIGCSDKADTIPTTATQSVATQSTEPVPAPITTVNVTFNALTYNGIPYEFVLNVPEDSNELEKRTSNILFQVSPGADILTVIQAQGYTNLTPVELHDEFVGWMEYKVIPAVDENGVAIANYEKLSGDTYYTTEEVLKKPVPEYDVTYVAKWKNIEDTYYQALGY